MVFIAVVVDINRGVVVDVLVIGARVVIFEVVGGLFIANGRTVVKGRMVVVARVVVLCVVVGLVVVGVVFGGGDVFVPCVDCRRSCGDVAVNLMTS